MAVKTVEKPLGPSGIGMSVIIYMAQCDTIPIPYDTGEYDVSIVQFEMKLHRNESQRCAASALLYHFISAIRKSHNMHWMP